MAYYLRWSLIALCLMVGPLLHSENGALPQSNSASSTQMVTPNQDPVAISLLSETKSVQPGQPLWVAVNFQIDKNWHAYWKNPGDAGMAPVINWNLPEGFSVNSVLWPTPKRFSVGPSTGFGYDGEFVLLVELTPPQSITTDQIPLNASIRWVVCSEDTCLPGDTDINLNLSVNHDTPFVNSEHEALFSRTRADMPKILLREQGEISVERINNRLNLVFEDKADGKQPAINAEFFPEDKNAIKTQEQPILEPSQETPGRYTLSFEEKTAQSHLKGVLVMHSATGKEAYEVNTLIIDSEPKNEIASAQPFNEHQQAPAMNDPSMAHSEFNFKGGVLLAIVLAFIGGMILNLMPCVLPVISFKILSFIKLSGENRKLIFKHGIAFSAGVLLSFWVLASLLLGLQAYGRSVGWGFQLQEPLFVAILAAFIFIFGLSLFGLFELGTSVMAKAGELQGRSKAKRELFGSFLSGILATAVATPCTGPFLGSAVGFAVTLPAYQAMTIFTSLGLGMSFPYLAIAAYPSLLRFLPKPGAWMETFKHLMGFLMIASVLWLLWVFGAQTGAFSLTLLLGGFFFLSAACWVYGRWATPMCKMTTRRLGTLVTILLFATGGYTIVESTAPWAQAYGGHHSGVFNVADGWEEYSPERVVALKERGIPVFIDFTAKWCLICQANHFVLSTDQVEKKFRESGIVRMKADWTKRDEVITQALEKYGRNSVPLYVLEDGSPKSNVQLLPQVLTPEIVIAAIDRISKKKSEGVLE